MSAARSRVGAGEIPIRRVIVGGTRSVLAFPIIWTKIAAARYVRQVGEKCSLVFSTLQQLPFT